jgi:hypothetical protein
MALQPPRSQRFVYRGDGGLVLGRFKAGMHPQVACHYHAFYFGVMVDAQPLFGPIATAQRAREVTQVLVTAGAELVAGRKTFYVLAAQPVWEGIILDGIPPVVATEPGDLAGQVGLRLEVLQYFQEGRVDRTPRLRELMVKRRQTPAETLLRIQQLGAMGSVTLAVRRHIDAWVDQCRLRLSIILEQDVFFPKATFITRTGALTPGLLGRQTASVPEPDARQTPQLVAAG